MYASKYHLRPRASSASATERSPWPATFDSTETEHAGPAFHQAGGSCSEFKLGDTLSPRAGNLGGEVVEASQYGQALPSTIDTSQVMATVNTEDFSSSTHRVVWSDGHSHLIGTPQLSHPSPPSTFQIFHWRPTWGHVIPTWCKRAKIQIFHWLPYVVHETRIAS